MDSIYYTLKKYWGYTSFRPLQREVIEALIKGADVLALMPTGGGKSVCFQIPAMLQKGVCLVVSPLIALMQDQVIQLKKRGIPAACIVSGMDKKQIDVILDNCIYGPVKFLYISPERLHTELFLVRLQKMKINLLVVDEAHCISVWGEDFRPAYKQINRIKPLLPGVSTLALTATATSQAKKDIILQLQLHNTKVFQSTLIRKNLAYVVRKTPDISAQLIRLLQSVAGSALVYTTRRSSTKVIADVLCKKNIAATYYHAGLDPALRIQRQKVWIENDKRVMVATNAFGMGIDKPDVRMVIHVDLPTSLEAYYQEAGRAGRDGKKAYAVVLYNSDRIQNLKADIQRAYPSIDNIKKVYQCLANYYQIAVGSHKMVSYDFDIEDFAHTYQISSSTIRRAIRWLEEGGLIQYNDRFFSPDKVHITALPKVLYAFQLAHKHHDKLIQALVHIYGDKLFHDFCTISLKRLAHYLKKNKEELNTQLKHLDTLAILHYIPQKNHAQITFITSRYAQEDLPLSVHKLAQRKKTTLDKSQEVLHYIRHEHRCRAQLLVEYFGEISYEKCTICDVCLREQKNNKYRTKDLQHYRNLILEQIKKGHCSVYHIVQAIDPDKADLLSKIIRKMIDRGELAYDKMLRLAQI